MNFLILQASHPGLLELGWSKILVVVFRVDFLEWRWCLVYHLTETSTVAVALLYTGITAEVQHMADLILAVIVFIGFFRATEVAM